MSWEAVRNLALMEKALRWIMRAVQQMKDKDKLQPWLTELQETFAGIVSAIAANERL